MKLPALKPRLRFSIRAMLVLMTLVCVWLAYSMNWIRQRRAVIASERVSVMEGRPDDTPAAPGLLWVFGEKGYFAILVDEQTAEETAATTALFPEVVEVIEVIHEDPFDLIVEYLSDLLASIVSWGKAPEGTNPPLGG